MWRVSERSDALFLCPHFFGTQLLMEFGVAAVVVHGLFGGDVV